MEYDENLERWDKAKEAATVAAHIMPHDQQIKFLQMNGWTNRGDWNNWFDPRAGWNHSLFHGVVAEIQEQIYNAGSKN